jgi:hypothetical protein
MAILRSLTLIHEQGRPAMSFRVIDLHLTKQTHVYAPCISFVLIPLIAQVISSLISVLGSCERSIGV